MDLTTKYLGLKLKNPLVPSASPLSTNVDKVKELEDNGAAAVVMYSLFEEQINHDKEELDTLLDCISKTIKYAPNRVKYAMNGFVIAVGSYVPDLTERAIEIGKKIGKVEVEMSGTSCKVPSSPEYIEKVQKMGKTGKKKKMARC